MTNAERLITEGIDSDTAKRILIMQRPALGDIQADDFDEDDLMVNLAIDRAVDCINMARGEAPLSNEMRILDHEEFQMISHRYLGAYIVRPSTDGKSAHLPHLFANFLQEHPEMIQFVALDYFINPPGTVYEWDGGRYLTCKRCITQVEITDPLNNDCPACGATYNSSGQMIAHPFGGPDEQWDPEP